MIPLVGVLYLLGLTREGEGKFMKRVASIQDISCLGRCSLTVALPVLSVMGVECAVIPTAVLSTHTIFPDFTCRDLTAELLPIARHWKSQQVRLDAICSGYLASPEQTEAVCRVFDLLRGEDTLIVVDPAMADHGRLYTPFAADFPEYMKKVCARADVLVPNLTEACLLTDTPYREDPDESFVRELLKKLSELAPRVVLTGVSFDAERLGAMCYDRTEDRYFSYFNRKIHAGFHGTGDIFAATVVGSMMQGKSLEQAVTLAVDFTLRCICCTCADPDASWYGVEFEKALPWLAEQNKPAEQ